jgi:4-hydroxybenzoate polyprenyltransferase
LNPGPSKLGVWLRLGRVSNLPSVWSNVLAALALAGGLVPEPRVLALALAFSVFYVGGMYLNDAFDRHIDAVERPTRPIPSGQVSAAIVFGVGFGALALGTLLTALVAQRTGASVTRATASSLVLAACIVFYDAYHKKNPLSPLVMGACRVMIYVAVAYSVSDQLARAVLLGAASLWCHLIGLTYAAKQEAFNKLTRVWPLAFLLMPAVYGVVLALEQPLVWPFLALYVAWTFYALRFLRPGPTRAVPQAVVRLIAAISLLDALLIASTGAWLGAAIAASMCALTRLFQRVVPGT